MMTSVSHEPHEMRLAASLTLAISVVSFVAVTVDKSKSSVKSAVCKVKALSGDILS